MTVVVAFKMAFFHNENDMRVKQFLKSVLHPLRVAIGLIQSHKFNSNIYLLISEIILIILSNYSYYFLKLLARNIFHIFYFLQ